MLRHPALVALPLLALLAPVPPARAQQARPALDKVGRALIADLQRAGQDMASEGLAQWILTSRNDALKAGVQPIPQAVRTRLKGQFPEALLARVRYRVGGGKDYSLQANAFKGNTAAITLYDIILFRPEKGMTDNVHLWAHELAHVQQYAQWGVRGFARRYTLDHPGVEADAEARAVKIMAAVKAAGHR